MQVNHLAVSSFDYVENLLTNVIHDRNQLRKYVSNHPWVEFLADPLSVIVGSPLLSFDGEGDTVKVRSATWPSIFAVFTQEALKQIALEYALCIKYGVNEEDKMANEWVAKIENALSDPLNNSIADDSSKTGFMLGTTRTFIGQPASNATAIVELVSEWNDGRSNGERTLHDAYESGKATDQGTTVTQQGSKSRVFTFDSGLKQLLNDMFNKATGEDVDVATLINDLNREINTLNEDKLIIQDVAEEKYNKLFLENEHLAQVNLDRENAISSLNQKLNEAQRPTTTTGSGEDRPDGTIDWTPAWRVFGNQKVIDMVDQGSEPPSLFNFDVPVFDYGAETHCDVPELDSNYEFDKGVLSPVLWALSNNKTVYLTGDTGTGKTTHIEQIGAMLKWPTLRINMDSEMSRMDFIGRDTLVQENGTTVSRFVEGILPQAMQQGVILIADEVDFGLSDIMYAFQSVLENGGSLRLTEDGGRIVKPHPMFRIVATANTKGQGDENGCYQGARVQSQAFLDRFQVWVSQDYLSAEKEARIIKSRVPTIEDKPLDQLIKVAGEIRKAFRNGEVLTTVSPRGLETCAAFCTALGGTSENLQKAIKHCIAGRCTDVDAMKVEEFVKAHVI